MPHELRRFEQLGDEAVVSPSGSWALRYRADGCAVIVDGGGTTCDDRPYLSHAEPNCHQSLLRHCRWM